MYRRPPSLRNRIFPEGGEKSVHRLIEYCCFYCVIFNVQECCLRPHNIWNGWVEFCFQRKTERWWRNVTAELSKDLKGQSVLKTAFGKWTFSFVCLNRNRSFRPGYLATPPIFLSHLACFKCYINIPRSIIHKAKNTNDSYDTNKNFIFFRNNSCVKINL